MHSFSVFKPETQFIAKKLAKAAETFFSNFAQVMKHLCSLGQSFPRTRRHPQRISQNCFCMGWTWSDCPCFQPYTLIRRRESYHKRIHSYIFKNRVKINLTLMSCLLPKVFHNCILRSGGVGPLRSRVTQVDIQSFVLGHRCGLSLKEHGLP